MCGPQQPPEGHTVTTNMKMEEKEPQPTLTVEACTKELFTSDEFRVFCFKVLPCSKRFVHDWPSCPFAHPGEKAKRRDPRTHQYDCEMCPAVLKGETCELGAACHHSHHVFESWLHPQKYRTLLCKDGDQCHREVCFFAHGSKQLRTPERSHQQRMMTQQQQQQAGSRGNGGSNNHHHHNSRPAGSQQQLKQQQAPACGNGTSLVNGGSAHSSAPTNIADSQQQQHQQVLFRQQQGIDGCSPVQLQAHQLNGGNGHAGSDMSQLLQSLVAEASASKQEAEQHSRAAALAQHKLQLLEQLLGGSMQNGNTGAAAAFAGAAGVAGAGVPGMGGMCGRTPMASPVSGAWQQHPQQQLLPPAAQLLHLQQQMAAHGAYDSQYGPRRHSLDEALLRRARNLPGGSMSNLGSRAGAGGMWGASPSMPLPNLTAVTEGVVLDVPPPTSASSAAADIEALAAAFAAAGMPLEGQAVLSNMQGAGSMQQSACGSMLGPSASTAMAAAQLSGSSNGGWMLPPQQALDPWAQSMGASGDWVQGMAAPAPMGAFHSASQLPAIYNPAALLAGNGSISAPQLQSDYLLQLHAALQAGGMTEVPRHERASFDVAATYLRPLPGRVGGAGAAADVLPGADEGAATPNSGGMNRSSGCSNVQDAPVLSTVSEKLASNPIGGAGQLGWF